MISQRAELPIVALSVKVYQALLVAYPAKFQQEYGSQMVQVFQDCCLRTVRQGGTNGIIRLWAITLLDLVQSVISEYSQKEIEMKKEMKPQDIRRAGWALMLGSVVFSLGIFTMMLLNNSWYVAIALVALISMPLLAFGLFGLQRRYGDQTGGFGKNILLIGAIIGLLISIIGYFGEVGLLGGGYSSPWILIWAGPAVLFTCLVVFGVVALFKKPLPRWNILPFLAGFWFPVAFVIGTPMNSEGIILFIIQGIALVALGYILKSDVPEETAAPA